MEVLIRVNSGKHLVPMVFCQLFRDHEVRNIKKTGAENLSFPSYFVSCFMSNIKVTNMKRSRHFWKKQAPKAGGCAILTNADVLLTSTDFYRLSSF